ncbi:MAG TPA: RNA methyltransferase PUA domain-containing protein, partial [Acidimicrobiales bacterium]|nr:RNA methyltransferase PUA domain-containing protein [Acidimicrobiales bacterium]
MASPAALAGIAVRAAATAQVFVDDPAHPVLSEEDAHHLGRVLRLRPGEEVVVSDGRGAWARTTWVG